MKNKPIVVGLAMVLGFATSFTTAQAQIGGAPANADDVVGAGTGNYGRDSNYSGHQATPQWNGAVQNYSSPPILNPGQNQHSANQTPYVEPMYQDPSVRPGPTGLNMVSTAPMAPGTGSIGNTPFPSGQFSYGFNQRGAQAYYGAYNNQRGGQQDPRQGGMLPNVSTGSVDFNTVDMTGIAGAGMISPGRGMGAPIGRPAAPTITMPSASSSTSSIYSWLNSTFFGP